MFSSYSASVGRLKALLPYLGPDLPQSSVLIGICPCGFLADAPTWSRLCRSRVPSSLESEVSVCIGNDPTSEINDLVGYSETCASRFRPQQFCLHVWSRILRRLRLTEPRTIVEPLALDGEDPHRAGRAGTWVAVFHTLGMCRDEVVVCTDAVVISA